MLGPETPTASFWEHLGELRVTLIRVFLILFFSVLFCLIFYSSLFNFLISPLNTSGPILKNRVELVSLTNESKILQRYDLEKGEKLFCKQKMSNEIFLQPGETALIERPVPRNRLVLMSPIEGFCTMCKVCFWFGFTLSSPVWLYLIFLFISPALQYGFRSLAPSFFALSTLSFALGSVYAFYGVLPLANRYLASLNETMGENLWSVSHYLNYSTFLLLASGFAFELALFGFYCVHYGFFSPEFLRKKRRHMVVLAFILGALLTPPDVLTQCLLAIPLTLFYELAILYSVFRFQKKEKNLALQKDL